MSASSEGRTQPAKAGFAQCPRALLSASPTGSRRGCPEVVSAPSLVGFEQRGTSVGHFQCARFSAGPPLPQALPL